MAETQPTQPPLKGPIAEKYIGPVATGLGILLIIGGIALGLNGRNKKVADLPAYSPVFITSPVPSTSIDTASPTPEVSTTPTDESEVATSSEFQSSKGGVSTVTNKTARTKVKATTQAAVIAQPTTNPTPLPQYTPNSELPMYTPVVEIPAYQPQFVSTPTPSPTPQTVSVNLSVPGNTYNVAVAPGSTVLTVFQNATKLGLNYRTEDFSGLGKMIIEINGQSQGGGMWWKYQINGAFAQKGVSTQTIKEGDTITWTLSNS